MMSQHAKGETRDEMSRSRLCVMGARSWRHGTTRKPEAGRASQYNK